MADNRFWESDSENSRLLYVQNGMRFLLSHYLTFNGYDESSMSINTEDFMRIMDRFVILGCKLNRNATENYLTSSLNIKKELVHACARETSLAIVNEIGDSNFSLLLGELDKSEKQQMTVVLRFVNKQGQIIERFLAIEPVGHTFELSLKATLDRLFASHGLSISRLRGQGYDKTSNMREQFNDLKTQILNENPFAFNVHCFSHELYLVLVYVAKSNAVVYQFFSYLAMIMNVMGDSCKRGDASLHRHMHREESGEIFAGSKHQSTTLVELGDTCCNSYYTTIIHLLTLWDSVLDVLENVYEDRSIVVQKGLTMDLFEKMESFEFVFILHLMMKLLEMTRELSNALQQKDKNIANSIELIEIVKGRIKALRETGWDDFLEEVSTFCVKMCIPVPNMEDEIRARGWMRPKKQWISCYNFYHAEIFVAVIDLVAAEVNNWFSESTIELLTCISCLDPRNSFSRFEHGKLIRLAEIYSDDFSMYDLQMLREQLHTYIHDVRRSADFTECCDLAGLARKMIETEKHLVFPLVYRLMELALILPMTSSDERDFSTMNIIKTELQDIIGDEWLNELMICYIGRPVFETVDDEDILQHLKENAKP